MPPRNTTCTHIPHCCCNTPNTVTHIGLHTSHIIYTAHSHTQPHHTAQTCTHTKHTSHAHTTRDHTHTHTQRKQPLPSQGQLLQCQCNLGNHLLLPAANHSHCHHHHRSRNIPHGQEHLSVHAAVPANKDVCLEPPAHPKSCLGTSGFHLVLWSECPGAFSSSPDRNSAVTSMHRPPPSLFPCPTGHCPPLSKESCFPS